MGSGGYNRGNLSTSRFGSVDSFLLIDKYQAENKVILKIDSVVHVVSLCKVANNYGGRDRIYFNCPRCNSRIRILYASSKSLFCRNCVKLSYPSQQCGHDSIVFHQLLPLFRKLKANTSNEYMIQYLPPRPAYMRYNVYSEIIQRITALQNRHWTYSNNKAQKFISNHQKLK